MERKRPYVKYYEKGTPIPQFVVQPSLRAQRVFAVGERRAIVAWERGRSLEQFIPSRLALGSKRRLIDGLADLVLDHLLLGTAHGDLNPGNILVAQARRAKARGRVLRPISVLGGFRAGKPFRVKLPRSLRLKAVDYGYSRLLSGKGLGMVTHDYQNVLHGVVPKLARSLEESRRLKGYFERRFLEKMGKKV